MSELVVIGVRILEFLFFSGFVGAALVILLSGVEDLHSLVEPNPTEEER